MDALTKGLLGERPWAECAADFLLLKQAELPANYRPAGSASERCDHCAFYEKGYCEKWDDEVDPAYTCDSFKSGVRHARGGYVRVGGVVKKRRRKKPPPTPPENGETSPPPEGGGEAPAPPPAVTKAASWMKTAARKRSLYQRYSDAGSTNVGQATGAATLGGMAGGALGIARGRSVRAALKGAALGAPLMLGAHYGLKALAPKRKSRGRTKAASWVWDPAKTAAVLTQAKRESLKASQFAVPEKKAKKIGVADEIQGDAKGKYPIPDKAHARNALARVAQFGTPAEKKMVRAKVKAKYPDIGEEKTAGWAGKSRYSARKLKMMIRKAKAREAMGTPTKGPEPFRLATDPGMQMSRQLTKVRMLSRRVSDAKMREALAQTRGERRRFMEGIFKRGSAAEKTAMGQLATTMAHAIPMATAAGVGAYYMGKKKKAKELGRGWGQRGARLRWGSKTAAAREVEPQGPPWTKGQAGALTAAGLAALGGGVYGTLTANPARATYQGMGGKLRRIAVNPKGIALLGAGLLGTTLGVPMVTKGAYELERAAKAEKAQKRREKMKKTAGARWDLFRLGYGAGLIAPVRMSRVLLKDRRGIPGWMQAGMAAGAATTPAVAGGLAYGTYRAVRKSAQPEKNASGMAKSAVGLLPLVGIGAAAGAGLGAGLQAMSLRRVAGDKSAGELLAEQRLGRLKEGPAPTTFPGKMRRILAEQDVQFARASKEHPAASTALNALVGGGLGAGAMGLMGKALRGRVR